ncbi:DUF4124 domain-containing protein [Exilibacterium tricleocarpae]|uniref:DUF4124 domain-containing protein n=1 Tax=Exilibacterium tricleocarpae TaxID=2591008 RepID=A0A545TZA9_9GAMM|nr:DUF4124 domain-containing protein [Exilibacterium tricleocarpae]TQV82523.1 DUF4124 domain-containing protein [Exilibacterium tricleocarpae]
MKLYIKFLLFILVLGLAGPFIMKGPDGRPLMDARQFIPDVASWPSRLERWWQRLLSEGETLVEEGPAAVGKTKVYKWRAADGSWRFSDAPNPDGQSEELWLDPDSNVIQSTPLPAQTEGVEKEAAQGPGNGIPLPLTVTPGQASKLIDDARKVQELMDQRNQALQEALGERPKQD